MIVYEKIEQPAIEEKYRFVEISDKTIAERLQNVKKAMRNSGVDCLLVYADKEHGSNFEYLTGFVPRFEEALLIIAQEKNTIIVGNENVKLAMKSRIRCKVLCAPYFSLPNQPMDNASTFREILETAGINAGMKIGTVGWKVFTSRFEDNKDLIEIPYFIISAITNIIGKNGSIKNHSSIFMKDVRCVNNANEIAHYAYGAALSSNAILEVMREIKEGSNDLEMASMLEKDGQYHSTITIFATGQRYEKANLYPRDKKISRGETLSMSVGYKGGLSCRNCFVAYGKDDLPIEQKDYLERIAKPYFECYSSWLENIKIGMTGSEMYRKVEEVFPKEKYGWHLNPGHLSADEEWLSSPIYEDSKETIKSGMIFQIDIIPSIKGYQGVNCEESVAIADKNLQKELETEYPELWKNITRRKQYIRNVLNIDISDDVIPLSNAVAYLNPYILNKGYALKRGK